MSIKLAVPEKTVMHLKPRISVIGVGGGGGNAVNNMIAQNLEGVDFIVANTDAQALAHSSASRKIQLGLETTQGLGAGARPEIGKLAAEEAQEEIEKELEGANMVFITAGMGGGTGSGAAPVVAKLAKSKGILTVGVVTKPFQFEGRKRFETAEAAVEEFTKQVDSIIIIPNQNLFRIADKNTTLADAFVMADNVLYAGVRSITDLMMMPGLINLDFADIKSIMEDKGKAIMGTGEAEGEDRAVKAAEQALSNPLLDDCSMHGAKGVLINITGGQDITLFAIDNKISPEEESHGRSGKSFCFSALNIFKKSVTLAGRNPEITKNPHIYDRVTEYTDYILVDDADRYLPFEFFYDTITGVMTVNPKNNQSYEIPFSKSPKFCFTSNFPLRNSDDSTEARVLYTAFSDYYHEKTERNNYKETRKIADDFGKNLFDDYNEEEWNADLNFFAQCLKFYLSVPSPRKIDAPLKDVTLRKLLADMGSNFKEWADVYFDPEGNHVNVCIVREEALEDFVKSTKTTRWTTNKFTKSLKSYCAYNGYTLNPKDLQNSQGRITRKIEGTPKDMIYVKTKTIDPVKKINDLFPIYSGCFH